MRRHLLPLGLILLAAVLFAPLCRTFVREVVIIPFLYIFWIGKFFTDTIPQAIKIEMAFKRKTNQGDLEKTIFIPIGTGEQKIDLSQ